MASNYDSSYYGREQSLIKHIILDKYLERFALIVGKGYDGILYLDGFSGPWDVQSSDLKDASFSIALNQLRAARETVRKTFNKELSIKCIFLEKEPKAFRRLKAFAEAQADADILPLNRDFEQAVPELVTLIRRAGRGIFPFIFIDPKGWKGFSMELITPLIQIKPCELLINFMTGFILRFVEDERAGIDSSFQRLFGDASFRTKFKDLEGKAREDAVVFEYAERVARIGRFDHVPVTLVPHPSKDRTHFHLVYATRNLKGLEVFKEAERYALNLVGELRADAKRRDREARTHQSEMFGGTELPEMTYMQELIAHYGAIARKEVHALIGSKHEIDYDEVYAVGMRFPLVQVAALRVWIAEIADTMIGEREKVAKLGAGHRIRLR